MTEIDLKSIDGKTFSFATALELLETEVNVARKGWNGKEMHLGLYKPCEKDKMTLPYIYMHTACGNVVPWVASQADLLSRDWVVVKEK